MSLFSAVNSQAQLLVYCIVIGAWISIKVFKLPGRRVGMSSRPKSEWKIVQICLVGVVVIVVEHSFSHFLWSSTYIFIVAHCSSSSARKYRFYFNATLVDLQHWDDNIINTLGSVNKSLITLYFCSILLVFKSKISNKSSGLLFLCTIPSLFSQAIIC